MNCSKLIYLLCGILCLSVCAAAKPPAAPAAIKWTRESIAGLTIELVDPVDFERIDFSADGFVKVTDGPKGGPFMRPMFKWRVVRGRLQFYSGRKVLSELVLVSRDSSTIVIRRRGKAVEYKILSE